MTPTVSLNLFIIKLASRCNLNCSYCYVYNQADVTWKSRPALMSDETLDATVGRIRRHVLASGQRTVLILFHGGEPTLIGADKFEFVCKRIRSGLEDIAQVSLGIQTNGTLLNHRWAQILNGQDVQVGISMDGPKEVHDIFRIDHGGRGSYDSVARGVETLRIAGLPFTILSVVQPGADSLRIHRHFLALGCRSISYLLPAYTHDNVEPLRAKFGPTPCADFLIPIFDDWWFNGTVDVCIREFWNIGRVIMGGASELDSIGTPPLRFVAIDTDGSMEGLDKLRSCENGMTGTGLTVHEADFADIAKRSRFHREAMDGLSLCDQCQGCVERDTCAGGYLPNRYSRARLFDNPSVWCADLLKLFGHIRHRMGVTADETIARRHELHTIQRRACAL